MGLLVVARTTMVAMVPVFLMAVWWRARPAFPRVALATVLAAALPFVPFAIANWQELVFAMYGSYQKVMKGFVWPQTTWVQHTVGLTGVLLANQQQRWVEAVQVVLMLAVYAACWRMLRRGRPALPWMALALLAFSMTTLWPVIYIYFDVFLLLVAAFIASAWKPRAVAAPWISTLATASVVVIATAWTMLPAEPVLDVGAGSARQFLRSGFADNEREQERTFAWVEGRRAQVVLPRRSTRAAIVDIDCQPFLPTARSGQQLSAVLNGTPIGTASLAGGWQRISFETGSDVWQIGANQLELFLSSSGSLEEYGLGADRRSLSVALDQVRVRSRVPDP
jgi:hypothetical protein